MAFLVLAVGVVMIGAGCYEIYYGSNYISLERGWSAFISGTVLLTGGLLTLALGLAIRALADLRSVLVRVAQPAIADAIRPEPPMTPSADGLAFDRETSPLSGNAGPLFETLMPTSVPVPPEENAPLNAAPARLADREAKPVEHHRHDPEQDEPMESMHDERGPVTDVPRGERAGVPIETAPAMDDWLDRSFADVGDNRASRDPVEGGSRMSADETVSAQVPLKGENDQADRARQRDQTAAQGRQPTQREVESKSSDLERPALAPAQSAVIGRYEAEGTSYIMYADGSIEAQSDAGFYRFASMAELKSFIEG